MKTVHLFCRIVVRKEIVSIVYLTGCLESRYSAKLIVFFLLSQNVYHLPRSGSGLETDSLGMGWGCFLKLAGLLSLLNHFRQL